MGKKFDEVKSSVSCSYLFEAQGQFDRLAETLGVGDLLASALIKSHLRCQLPQYLAPVRAVRSSNELQTRCTTVAIPAGRLLIWTLHALKQIKYTVKPKIRA